MPIEFLWIYLIFIGAMSIATFFTYLADKIKAQKGAFRIKEAVLLALGFFGGALGALICMGACRHKTKHWYFWAVNGLGMAVHIAGAIWILVEVIKYTKA